VASVPVVLAQAAQDVRVLAAIVRMRHVAKATSATKHAARAVPVPAVHARQGKVKASSGHHALMAIRAMRRAFLPTTPTLAPTTHTASSRARRVRRAHARLAIVRPATMPVHAPLVHAAQVVHLAVATADLAGRVVVVTVDRKGRFGAFFMKSSVWERRE
jgi:hypothetical protein